MHEYIKLFAAMANSGCSKKQTACGTYVNGEWVQAVNFCEYQGDSCPRIGMPSGQGYELCRAHHAEANLALKIAHECKRSDGIAWLTGHYWACEPCAAALKEIGVREIRIMESQVK